MVDSSGSSMDVRGDEEKEDVRCVSILSPQLKAMIRIKKKYLKRSNSIRSAYGSNTAGPDGISHPKSPQTRKSKRRKSRVLFPNDTLMFRPKKEHSRAKPFLVLFSIIVFIQVYNAIENLDDHVLKYDLEGLERTLNREVFGQQEVLEQLMEHLNDYLSTYAHQHPLALSLHGPSGVGKSHLGRLLARHFRSIVNDKLVVHYITKHQCPLQEAARNCASALAKRITEVVTRAEEEEQISFFILDEVEMMPPLLLDTLQMFLRSNQTNEFLNVVYVFLSSLGQVEITAHMLHNASTAGALKSLRGALALIHPLWMESAVEVVPLSLLERRHVLQCFQEEMTLEGFYPDLADVERLADELAYHRAAGKLYAKTGCKQVEEMTLEGFYPNLADVERLADELAYHRAAGKLYAKTGCKQVEEMTLEDFYPDLADVERLVDELAYHRAAGKLYTKTGCKQVVGKVNLL